MTLPRWDVPESWKWVEAGDVAEIVGGGTPPSKDDGNFREPGKGIPWVGPADLTAYRDAYIGRGRRDLSKKGLAASGATLMPAGAVLFSSRAPIGYCAIASNPISTNQGFKSWVCAEGLIPEYIRHYLLASVDYVDSLASGTTFREVSGKRVASIAFPLAPEIEQRRIVAKLDALTASLARVRAELDRVPVLAEHLRIASLGAAFRGDLSVDCRSAAHEQVRKTLPQLDDQERGIWQTESVPSSWQWVGFEDFFDDMTDSKRKLPEKEYDSSGPYPVIDQGRKQVGGYTARHDLLHPARVPVVIFGDHTRCVKLVETPFVQGADGVKVLAPAQDVSVTYARYALLAVEIPAKGYSRHMKFVRKTIWPLPPLREQAVIVERLDAAFTRADRLEAEAARARALLDRLGSAILAKAFRGELVPQDPNDEPASVLLDRIRAQRAAAPRPKRGRRQVSADA